MAGGALKLRDLRKLAETRAAFEFELPVTELPGLPRELSAGDGRVQVQLRFGREQGFAVADVEVRASLQLVCQRCLGPLPLAVRARSPVLVVESERAADEAPAGWETFLAPEGRLSLAALAAEELLLAVPIVPLHGADASCVPAAAIGQTPAEQPGRAKDPATVRPFADLRALLERGGKATD